MEILAYIKRLIPWLKKDDVLEDLRITVAEFDKTVLPSYETAIDVPFKSNNKEIKALVATFVRNYKRTKPGKQIIISSINEALPAVVAIAKYLEHELDESLAKDIIADGLEARRVILVRASEHLSFISRYSVDLLNTLYAYEIGATTGNVDVNPQIIKYINANLPTFCTLLAAYSVKLDLFKHNIDKVPALVISNDNIDALKGVYSQNTIDPVLSGITASFSYNPIYHIRLQIADYQAYRYTAMKDKKKALELRVMYLRSAQEEKPDPKVEQEISYQQSRIEAMEYKLRKIEASVGMQS